MASKQTRRIGILTFWQAVNAGAFLQKYALQKTVQKITQGEVSVVRYPSRFRLNEFRSRFHGSRGIRRVTSLLEAIAYWQQTRSDCTYTKSMLRPWDRQWSEFDTVVVGSDEVWNTENWFSGFCPLLFGEGVVGPRKIAYAPSFGEVSDVSKLPPGIGQLLGDFRHVSVRDANAQNLVAQLIGKVPTLVLDPTLIYDFEDELLRFKDRSLRDVLAVYATSVTESQWEKIEAYARRQNLRIVSLGFALKRPGIQQSHNLHPFETLAVIRSARCVFTNTFHGAALALKYARPVILGSIAGKQNKLKSLYAMLQMTPAFADDGFDFLEASNDNARLYKEALNQKRRESLAWLESALRLDDQEKL